MGQAVSIVRVEDGRKRTEEKKLSPFGGLTPQSVSTCPGGHRERDLILYIVIELVSERARGTILYFTPRSHIPRTTNCVRGCSRRDPPKIDSSHNHSMDLYLYI